MAITGLIIYRQNGGDNRLTANSIKQSPHHTNYFTTNHANISPEDSRIKYHIDILFLCLTLSSLFNPNKLSSDPRKAYQITTYTLYKSLILYNSCPYLTALFLFNTEVVKNVENVVFFDNVRRFDRSRKRQPVPQTVVSPRVARVAPKFDFKGRVGELSHSRYKTAKWGDVKAVPKSTKNTTFPCVNRPLAKG